MSVWQWEQGDYMIQAYTYPKDYPHGLIIKRYSKYDFNDAMMSGAHQLLYDDKAPDTERELKQILASFGCPESLLNK